MKNKYIEKWLESKEPIYNVDRIYYPELLEELKELSPTKVLCSYCNHWETYYHNGMCASCGEHEEFNIYKGVKLNEKQTEELIKYKSKQHENIKEAT